MAGRANRGRGSGRGNREGFWSDQPWWNHGFPPHPSFPPPQFPSPYGFYPHMPVPPMHMLMQGP
jgi:hypothetical protein